MPVELFHKVIQKISATVPEVYFHVMGEPTLHPELEIFFKICEEYGVSVNLTTNGTLIHHVGNILLKAPNLRQVNFSVHALESIEKEQKSRELIKNIFEFSSRALQERPDLYLNYRLWNAESDTLKLPEWNKKFFLKLNEKFSVEIEENLISKTHKSIPIKGRLYLHFDTRFVWPSTSKALEQNIGSCLALKTHCAILTDGRVVACCLDDQGQLEIGKINESSFEDILMSPRAKTMRNGFQNKLLIESVCRKCTYCRRFQK